MNSTQIDLNAEVKSRYTITTSKQGFVIEGRDRTPVTVRLCPTYLEVTFPLPEERVDLHGNTCDQARRMFGFFDYYALSRYIAAASMSHWQPPESKQRPGRSHPPQWGVTLRARELGKSIHAEWRQLLSQVDPTVLDVHRACFAATYGCPDLIMDNALYRHPFLVRDLIHFRAAAIAAAGIETLGPSYEEHSIRQSHAYRSLLAQARQRNLGVTVGLDHSRATITTEDRLHWMYQWRGLFSPTGAPYRSLNRTLMNLPGGVSVNLVCALRKITLPRPLLSRSELIMVGALIANSDIHYNIVDDQERTGIQYRNGKVFLHASAQQIREALRRVSTHTRNQLTFRRTTHLMFLADFLADYPEAHHGNLVGLTDKSIRWHREIHAQTIDTQINRLGETTLTAQPPATLPDITGVHFLATVGEVCSEGEKMDHCIAAYADGAVAGRYYLFHVERHGEQASIMMSTDGQVVQAHGPGNQRNKAAIWGKRVLGRWGRNLPAQTREAT